MAFRTSSARRVSYFVAAASFVALLVASAACSSSKDDPPGGSSGAISDGALPESCRDLAAPTECPSPAPAYDSVKPIFEARCTNTCHAGVPGGPWSLRDYEHIVDWADSIRGELLGCSMPPLDAGVPITKEERLAILTWIRCDTPH